MKLSVWGLGYVGTVSAGCLAQEGHEAIGLDIGGVRADFINADAGTAGSRVAAFKHGARYHHGERSCGCR
jgi:UDP-N-acetyl-D-mannosaminuronate dehydrogenase